ncbi:MAG: hypothetical protein MJ094_00705 [Saccharofermentans sp.]|nr:hypothetical protein [Saccharofermentans sp.]
MKAKLYKRNVHIDNINSYLEQDEDCNFRVGEGQKPSLDPRSVMTTIIAFLFFITIVFMILRPNGMDVFKHTGNGYVATAGLIPFIAIIGIMLLYMIVDAICYVVTLVNMKKCDFPVKAKIIMLEERIQSRRRGPAVHYYYPVYHYYYAGKHYIARSDDRSYKINKVNYTMYLGQDEMVLINSDNPYSCKPEDDVEFSGLKLFTYVFTIVILTIMISMMLMTTFKIR